MAGYVADVNGRQFINQSLSEKELHDDSAAVLITLPVHRAVTHNSPDAFCLLL